MLTIERTENSNILEFTLNGGFNWEEFDQVATHIEQMISAYGKVRLIEVIENIGPIEPSALWEYLKFAPKYLNNFSHVAVVADQEWIEWLSKLSRPFLTAELRTFRLDELDQARQWIRYDLPIA